MVAVGENAVAGTKQSHPMTSDVWIFLMTWNENVFVHTHSIGGNPKLVTMGVLLNVNYEGNLEFHPLAPAKEVSISYNRDGHTSFLSKCEI